jgi:hypothetical protein
MYYCKNIDQQITVKAKADVTIKVIKAIYQIDHADCIL